MRFVDDAHIGADKVTDGFYLTFSLRINEADVVMLLRNEQVKRQVINVDVSLACTV